jgi:two-component system CheB/CheR fusion protein
LKPSGFLALGLSESVGASTELFILVDKRLRIYARKMGVSTVPQLDLASNEATGRNDEVRNASPVRAALDVQRRVDQYILSRYSPAGVLVDDDLNVLQFHGHTSPYLEHAAGEPALNMTRMLRGELTVEFRKLFDRARKKQMAIKGEPIPISYLDRIHSVRICVTPMVLPGSAETQYLTLFEEFPVSAGGAERRREPQANETEGDSTRRAKESLNRPTKRSNPVTRNCRARTRSYSLLRRNSSPLTRN